MLSILLNHFVIQVIGKRLFTRPRAVMSVSAAANEIEKRQLIVGMFEAGARRTQLLERPLAAALGTGVNIMEHYGRMVADIGGATTDIAVIASGELMSRSIIDAAGDQFTEAIIRYIRLKHNLLIGVRTARTSNTPSARSIRGRMPVCRLPSQGATWFRACPRRWR